MRLLESFHGSYVNAASASTMLDISTILEGCSEVENEANHISEYVNKIADISSSMNKDNFSINGETVYKLVDDYCTQMNDVEVQIMSMVEQIRAAVEAQYNKIQEQLNYEAQVKNNNEYNKRKGK